MAHTDGAHLLTGDDGKQVVSVDHGKIATYTLQEEKFPVHSDEDKYFVASRSSVDTPEVIPAISSHINGGYGMVGNNQYNEDGYSGYDGNTQQPVVPQKKSRKKFCWILGAILVAAVILAAVLGGVLGSRSSKSSSSEPVASNSTSDDSPPRPLKSTSLAATTGQSSNKFLLYYQSENGSLVEATYNLNTLTNSSSSNNISSVTADWSFLPATADTNTALAAATYKNLGSSTSQNVVLFVSEGRIAQTNRSAPGNAWSEQSKISNSTIATHSRALTICADTVYIGGFRIYYGSAEGFIRQITYRMSDNTYFSAWPFTGTDPNSGVVCTLEKTDKKTCWNMYMRNSTTGSLFQSWWSFPEPSNLDRGSWPINSSPYTVDSGANFTAAFDGSAFDYVAASSGNGTVSLGTASSHGSQWLSASSSTLNAGLDTSSVMSSWYIEGTGTVYAFQDEDGGIKAMTANGGINLTIV